MCLLDCSAVRPHADGKYSDPEKANQAAFLDRLANVYREQNKTSEAVATYKELISLGKDYVKSGYQGEIDAYRDVHQWKDATTGAAEAAGALPKHLGVLLMYAGQLADTGQVEQGIAVAKAQLLQRSRRPTGPRSLPRPRSDLHTLV